MIYAFDHVHNPGDVCSRATCEHARRAPVLAGSAELHDLPMRIRRAATEREYLTQEIPVDWTLPALEHGCTHFYSVIPCEIWRRQMTDEEFEKSKAEIFRRWDGLLRRLAKGPE